MFRAMRRPSTGPSPVEHASGEPPTGAEWRADALARSRHSRLDDALVEPLADDDPRRAALVCADVTRRALRDFAPALVLLPLAERRRAQGLAAFALTLFDFARQSSLEGEKLAQINRWAFELEAALDGAPAGQPVFVALAAATADRPWSRPPLEGLVACARRRALAPRAVTLAALERRTEELARSLTAALCEDAEGVVPSVSALLRLHGLLVLGDDRRRHQASLPVDELPESWQGEDDRAALEEAVRRECGRLGELMAAPSALHRLAPGWRRAMSYGVLAGRELLRRVAAHGAGAVETPPRLGAGHRLVLLLRSRWLPL
jgi:phytoene/squalene synthetase